MPNLGAMLKQEITRLARRAIKPAYAELKKDVAELKHRAAQQRRTIQALEQANARLLADFNSRTGRLEAPAEEESGKIRLGPKLIQAQRKRLGLSQQEFAKLLGVSTNTLWLWEHGKTAPRAKSKAIFASVRQLGRREVKQKLQAISEAK